MSVTPARGMVLPQELDSQLATVEREMKSHEENALKRDKAIQGLAKALQKKSQEVSVVSGLFVVFFTSSRFSVSFYSQMLT